MLLKRIMILFPHKSPQFLDGIYQLYVEFATTKFDAPTISVLYHIIKMKLNRLFLMKVDILVVGLF